MSSDSLPEESHLLAPQAIETRQTRLRLERENIARLLRESRAVANEVSLSVRILFLFLYLSFCLKFTYDPLVLTPCGMPVEWCMYGICIYRRKTISRRLLGWSDPCVPFPPPCASCPRPN